jgi:hypothetical protein
MITLNSPLISQQPHMGIFINQHLTVLAAAEVTGYNIQYLRRLLRSGSLRDIKISQIWLIEIESLKAYLQHVENTSDRPRSPREIFILPVIQTV